MFQHCHVQHQFDSCFLISHLHRFLFEFPPFAFHRHEVEQSTVNLRMLQLQLGDNSIKLMRSKMYLALDWPRGSSGAARRQRTGAQTPKPLDRRPLAPFCQISRFTFTKFGANDSVYQLITIFLFLNTHNTIENSTFSFFICLFVFVCLEKIMITCVGEMEQRAGVD